MSTTVNTLAYLGIKEPNPPNLFFRDRDPLTSDYKIYDLLDIWENTLTRDVFMLVSKAGSIGTWVKFLPSPAGAIAGLTPDVGAQVLPLANNINVQGGGAGGIQFSNGGAGQLNAAVQVDGVTIQIIGNQLVAISGGVITWIETAISLLTTPDTGYIANGGVLIDLTLPAVVAQGEIVRVTGKGAGLFRVVANAGQTIFIGNQTSSVAGNLTATAQRDSVELVCITANTEWNVLNWVGNLTVN